MPRRPYAKVAQFKRESNWRKIWNLVGATFKAEGNYNGKK